MFEDYLPEYHEDFMAATPKPVRKRHKEQELEIKHKLKKVLPSEAKTILKGHKKEVKEKKSTFKKMGGSY